MLERMWLIEGKSFPYFPGLSQIEVILVWHSQNVKQVIQDSNNPELWDSLFGTHFVFKTEEGHKAAAGCFGSNYKINHKKLA